MKPLIIGVNLGDYGSTGNMMIHCLEYASKHGGFDYLVMTPKHTDKAPCVPYGEKKIGFFERAFCHFFIKWGWLIDGDFYRSRGKIIVRTIREHIRTGRKVIVHLHNIHHAALDVPYILRRLTKLDVPVLYTLHDCWSFTGGCYYYEEAKCDGFKQGCRRCPKGFKGAHRRLLRKAHPLLRMENITLLPCSKWLSDDCGMSAIASLKRIVVNGETSLKPMPYNQQFRDSLGLPSDAKILISVSKGARHLAALAKILPKNYYLYVVGEGMNHYSEERLISLGFLDHEEYANYLAVADCFVSVTPEDNLPLALMEAQLSGLPIVGFGHGGTPELITEKTGIMVGTDDDVNKLLRALIHVIEDKPFNRQDIIENGKQYALYEYGKRMLSLYSFALETKK